MYIVDDPTLALITRFLGDSRNLELSDAEFLFQQIEAIEQYVGQYPQAERQKRALEWIETYAQQYRRQWQKKVAVETLAQSRCADCPLSGGNRSAPCKVHSRWLELLQRYATSEISSQDYIQDALNLLTIYKTQLSVTRTRQRFQQASMLSEGAT